jgi:diguanylate cyclase (GGDEF)-like protein/PAS domain S-box-containing protein
MGQLFTRRSRPSNGTGDADTTGGLPRRTAGRLMAVLTLAGGLSVIAEHLPVDIEHFVTNLSLDLGAFALLLGVLMWFVPWQRLPRRTSLLGLPLAFGMIALGNVADPNPYTYGLPFVMMFLWIGASHPRTTSIWVLPLAAWAYVGPVLGAADSMVGSSVFTLGLCVAFGESLAWVMQQLGSAHTELTSKRIELANKRSEARFQALTRNVTEIVTVLDDAGTVQYCSNTIEGLLKISADELLQRPIWERIHPEDVVEVRRLLTNSSADEQHNHRAEFRMQHADGSWRHIEATCRDLRGEAEIGGLVLNARDVSDRKALESELAHRAFHDSLTELPNRELLVDRLGHALVRSARGDKLTAVLFIDLDGFKAVNDTLGHLAGDNLLVSVARRLCASVRPGDTVARMGGDEFILLLEDLSDVAEARSVAERCLEQLRAPIALDSQHVTVTASIGIACTGDGPTALPGELMKQADVAMYAAKTSGKGKIAVFDAKMTRTSLDGLTLQADLQVALEQGQFQVWYQPIIELHTGGLSGVEALVRWQHPTNGLVPPDAFIPAAEDSGMIVPIGRWVLREACRQAVEWRKDQPELTISVNLSARQFQYSGLVEDVSAALGDSGLPAEALKLEVTETVAMEAGIGSIQTFHALRGLGVRLAIDDFGTGYSSLAYLKRFPVDTLKVDRSFIDGIGHDEHDSAIVRSVVTLARSLGLTVTAEGIETTDQLDMVRTLECDEGQGFLFLRPKPSTEITDFIQQRYAAWYAAEHEAHFDHARWGTAAA